MLDFNVFCDLVKDHFYDLVDEMDAEDVEIQDGYSATAEEYFDENMSEEKADEAAWDAARDLYEGAVYDRD